MPTNSDEHDALKQAARALAQGPVAARAAEVDRSETYPWDNVADLVAAGTDESPLLVTLEPAIDPSHYAVGVVLGRAVRLVATSEIQEIAASGGHLSMGAMRVDRADLEDRRRWAADTLVQQGQTRILWEGPARLTVDRLYADYLVARPPGLDITRHQPNVVVRDNMRSPEGGILDLPPRPRPLGAPGSVTVGPTLSRMSGQRLFPVSLQQGVLNIVDLRAVSDPVGGYGLTVDVTTVPLDQIRDFPRRGD